MERARTGPVWVVDAALDAAQTDLFESIAQVESMIASMTGMRARLIDQAGDLLMAGLASGPASHGAEHDRALARDLLVAELAPLLRIPGGAAARLVAESRTLVARLPATLGALGTGEISYAHARIVVDQAESLPEDAHGEYEAAVLPAAKRLNTSRFRQSARRTRERAHPESIGTRRRSAFERREVRVDPARDGMVWLTAYVAAEVGIGIDDRLDRLAASMRDPADGRTFAQLRTDAFCDLLTRAEVPGVLQRGIRPQILVTVPVLTLLGQDDEPASLDGYGPIPAELARVIAADAPGFVRLLTHPETGAVLSVGRDRYTVPRDLRLWLRVRDETCRGIGCTRRAATSDIDHGHAWATGGRTDATNLAHLCRGDHTRKHRLGWTMTHLPDGTIRWTSPLGRTYLSEPSTQMRT
jgi:hypothetical protein